MGFQLNELNLLIPEVFLLVGVSIVLVVDLFLSESKRHYSYLLTQAVLLLSAVLAVGLFGMQPTEIMSGLVVIDDLGTALKICVCLLLSAGLKYSVVFLGPRELFKGEYFTLTLFSALGMMVMISANHLVALYLGLELLSLSLYAMVALRRDSGASSEAAIKYFILGAIASGMLLYGMSMLYGATGNLDIRAIVSSISSGHVDTNLLRVGLVFIIVGVGFKLGAVPFHMWVPDVYQGSPTSVTLLIGTAPKLAAFAFIVRLVAEAMGHESLHVDWQQMLLLLAIASLLLGNVVAIAQTNFKRMLAYSTIAHMGFLLIGFMTGTLSGYSSALFYVITYAVMALAGFGVILVLSRDNQEITDLTDFSGLSKTHPWIAFLLLIVMFSMAGIPPTVGFWAKLHVIQSVVSSGYVEVAVIAVIASLIGAYYYLRIVKLMYFDEPRDGVYTKNVTGGVLYTANGLALLVLGIMPGWSLIFCEQLISSSLRYLS